VKDMNCHHFVKYF